MSGNNSKESDLYRSDEAVDPRVQIELERLNAATDDINKLEVDLDEARANFRQLLYESSVRIDAIGMKLGSCVDKARVYYEARIKAKEALQATQLAAVRFERANSAHAAAKEMVFLAEEGLCAEGRTFDHAWQEMLNHATMRVNESELERTLSEADHRRTSQAYQTAEISVQQLEKELKRPIAKSSHNYKLERALSIIDVLLEALFLSGLPYFEMKAQYNQVLEDQKCRIKELEVKVSAAKSSYAEALHNLEQISDEIHRIRKNTRDLDVGKRGAGVGAESPSTPLVLSPDTRNTVSSSDRWTDSIGSSDSELQEEYLRLPDKLTPSSAPILPRNIREEGEEQSEYLSLPTVIENKENLNHSKKFKDKRERTSSRIMSSQPYQLLNKEECDKCNLENVDSSEEENMIQSIFSKIVPAKLRAANVSSGNGKVPTGANSNETINSITRNIPSDDCLHAGKGNLETWSEVSLASPDYDRHKTEVWTEVNLNDSSSPCSDLVENQESKATTNEEVSFSNPKSKPDSGLTTWISRSSVEQGSNSRRQSLDTLIMGGLATGERVKEIFSQGIMKLNITSLTDRRSSEPKFERSAVRLPPTLSTKKVPSPLEKSLVYLHPEDDSTSDSESLASVEMLTDDQISSLMMEQDLQEVCHNILGTPISEIAPLFSSSNHL